MAYWKTLQYGNLRIRVVEYSANYKADHWCTKGHILHVIAGNLIIEHKDQSQTPLTQGTTWHAADGAAPAHRVLCESGASVLIVD